MTKVSKEWRRVPEVAKIVTFEPYTHVRLVFNDGYENGKSITLTYLEFYSLMDAIDLFNRAGAGTK